MSNTQGEPSLSTQDPHSHPNQFALLGQRRFAPFFWTQFAGAGNDNLFKFAFTVMVTYQLSVSWLPPSLAGLVIGALFTLPYLLFSATSGQLTDKWDKTRMFRLVKNLEIVIMLVAAPLGVAVWAQTGNVLPWALVQGGGMLAVVWLTFLEPRRHALPVELGWVIGLYVVAKLLEMSDVDVFDVTGHMISGHSLKHWVAAAAALPVIRALHKRRDIS